MAKPIIAYNSMFHAVANPVVTDPGSESGFPVTNLYDYKGHTVWKSSVVTSPINIDIDNGGTPRDANYIALVNHNLPTSDATITVKAGSTFPPGTTVQAAFTPAESTVTFKTFTAPGALRYWRVIITAPVPPFFAAPYIGELFLGTRIDLPEYLSPSMDPFMTDAEVQGSRSEGGHFLGATIRGLTHRGVINFGAAGLARAWFTSDGNAFISNHARLRRPWFFVVDYDDTDFDTPYYLRVPDTSAIMRFAVGGAWSRLTLEIPYEEAFMEPAL